MRRGRVLVVDDDAEFRGLARRLLEAGGYLVVGEADDADSAMAAQATYQPDIVLLDVQLPGRDGFAIAEDLATAGASPIVVLVSSRHRVAYRRKLAVTAAHAFLAKDELTLSAFDRAIQP